MDKQHRIEIRKIGPAWQVRCPRCGMTWTRDQYLGAGGALDKSISHLTHQHPRTRG